MCVLGKEQLKRLQDFLPTSAWHFATTQQRKITKHYQYFKGGYFLDSQVLPNGRRDFFFHVSYSKMFWGGKGLTYLSSGQSNVTGMSDRVMTFQPEV